MVATLIVAWFYLRKPSPAATYAHGHARELPDFT